MAWLHIRLDEHQRAINLLQESIPLWRETSNRYGEPSALNLIGLAYSNLYDVQNALIYYTQSVELAEKTATVYSAAETLNNLGIQYWRPARLRPGARLL